MPGLRGFLGCRTSSAKTRSISGKLGFLVTLPPLPLLGCPPSIPASPVGVYEPDFKGVLQAGEACGGERDTFFYFSFPVPFPTNAFTFFSPASKGASLGQHSISLVILALALGRELVCHFNLPFLSIWPRTKGSPQYFTPQPTRAGHTELPSLFVHEQKSPCLYSW